MADFVPTNIDAEKVAVKVTHRVRARDLPLYLVSGKTRLSRGGPAL